MPAGFDRCIKNGGKVTTEKLSGNKYRHVCYIGGKSYPGYVKTRSGGKLHKAKKSAKKYK